MLKLDNAEFSIGDRCLLNIVHVDNENDKCWIYRFLVNNTGMLYGTWQVIDHRNKKTYMRISNGYGPLFILLKLGMNDTADPAKGDIIYPTYIYGELAGDDKIHNDHDFTDRFFYDKMLDYSSYDFRMSFRFDRKQYADYIEGVVSKPRAAVLPSDWYLTEQELATLPKSVYTPQEND